MAEAANLSQCHVFSIFKGKTNTSDTALAKLQSAGKILESPNAKERELRERIKRILKEQEVPIRKLAIKAGIDLSNLSKILSGHRGNIKHLENLGVCLKTIAKPPFGDLE